MTATTPPKSHQRLAQVQSQDVDDIVLRAAYLRMALVPPLALQDPFDALGLDVEAQALLDQLKDLDPDALRGILIWDLSRYPMEVVTNGGWKGQDGLDGWSVSWKVDAEVLVNATKARQTKTTFDEAVEDVVTDPTCLGSGALHAGEPQFGLLAMLGAVSATPASLRLTIAVVDTVVAVTMAMVNRLKTSMKVPRPGNWDTAKKPVPLLPVPATTSYPGGHAAVMAALKVVLPKLVKLTLEQKRVLTTEATKIVEDRVRMGLHTALDGEAGTQLGDALGNALVRLAMDGALMKSCPLWAGVFALAQKEWK